MNNIRPGPRPAPPPTLPELMAAVNKRVTDVQTQALEERRQRDVMAAQLQDAMLEVARLQKTNVELNTLLDEMRELQGKGRSR